MKVLFQMSDLFMFQLPRKIIFGNGAIQKIGEEAAGIFAGAKKVQMITDKGVSKAGLTEAATASLKKAGFEISVFDDVVPDPTVPLVMQCTQIARKQGAQIIFGIGGGSVMDLAKAVAVMAPSNDDVYQSLGTNQVKKPGLPKILVPTTAGTGSEISNSFVLTDDRSGDKIASSSPHAFSDLSIIDPVLTMTMPPRVTAESGMDAFSHALESFVTIRANPLSDLLSLRGIEVISQNLRKAFTKGTHNLQARYAMCFGVCLGTMAIRSSGMGVVHATCYPPAMKYHLTHGLAISLMMPSVMETNLISNFEKYSAVACAMGEKIDGRSPAEAAYASVKAVRQLIKDLGLPAGLRDVGGKKGDFHEFARTVVSRYAYHLVNNPRNLTEEDILRIYEAAW